MGGSSHKGNTKRTFEVEKLSGKKCHERKNIQDEVICVEEERKAEGRKEDDVEALELLQDQQASSLERAPEQLHQAAAAVDMIEKVRQVRDVLGDSFGGEFVAAMLQEMDQLVENVIVALLEDNIPLSLANMDRAASLQSSTAAASGGISVQGVGGGAAATGERANVLENDQFHVLKSDCVKFKGVHIKDLNEVPGQREALVDDERGAGSGGRATAFVADDACFARRGQEDTQQGTQGGRPRTRGMGSPSAKSVEKKDLGKQVIIPGDGKEIVGTRFLVLGERMYIT
jgi:hypothetical protein